MRNPSFSALESLKGIFLGKGVEDDNVEDDDVEKEDDDNVEE